MCLDREDSFGVPLMAVNKKKTVTEQNARWLVCGGATLMPRKYVYYMMLYGAITYIVMELW